METFLRDARYTFRMLGRNPGFTLIAVLTLALGIGASSAIFSVLHAVVLEPLPYPQPQQLVQLWMRFTGIGIPDDRNWVSAPEFIDVQHDNRSFSSIAAISSDSFNVTFAGTPERVEAAVVSPSLFPLLGVRPQIGRAFLPEEGTVGRDRVVLLSDGIWRRRFGADPHVAGRKLTMNGQPYLIAGVLPRGFQMPREAQIWTPLAFSPDDLSPNNRGSHGLQAIARIAPGLSLAQCRADMAMVSRRIIAEHPDYNYKKFNFTVLTVPLLEQQVGDLKSALWLLMGAVGFVLLIACANVANLLLARASTREQEMAVRQALGIGRARLRRQLLTESAILGLLGGLAGLLMAAWGLHALVALAAESFPRMNEVSLNPMVVLFTLAVSLATGLLFGMAPAFAAGRADPQAALKEGGRGGSVGGSSKRLRSTLVVCEVALALALLAGSGLMIRSFLRLMDVDAGFQARGVLTLRIALPDEKYSKVAQARNFYRELLARVRQLPGVEQVGAVTGLPLSGSGWSGTVTVDTRAVPADQITPEADQRPATPGYFEVLHIPLLRGRSFQESDNETTAPVCIIDQTMAATYWPHDDPIGKRIHQGGDKAEAPWMTVVGVVGHVRYRTLESPSRVEVYWPYAQSRYAVHNLSLAIRSAGSPAALVGPVRRAVQSIDPDQAVYDVRMMTDLLAESTARRRLSMSLLAVFAGVALLLAAVGIYGIMSYTVTQRAHEMGIRLALGAKATEVVGLVLRESLGLTVTGVLTGLVGSLLLSRSISSLLFGVKPYDPLTYTAVASLLMVVGLAASFVPAHRVTAVDPVRALRRE